MSRRSAIVLVKAPGAKRSMKFPLEPGVDLRPAVEDGEVAEEGRHVTVVLSAQLVTGLDRAQSCSRGVDRAVSVLMCLLSATRLRLARARRFVRSVQGHRHGRLELHREQARVLKL